MLSNDRDQRVPAGVYSLRFANLPRSRCTLPMASDSDFATTTTQLLQNVLVPSHSSWNSGPAMITKAWWMMVGLQTFSLCSYQSASSLHEIHNTFAFVFLMGSSPLKLSIQKLGPFFLRHLAVNVLCAGSRERKSSRLLPFEKLTSSEYSITLHQLPDELTASGSYIRHFCHPMLSLSLLLLLWYSRCPLPRSRRAW